MSHTEPRFGIEGLLPFWGENILLEIHQDGVLALFGLFCSTQRGHEGRGVSHDKNKMAGEKAKSLLLGDWDQKFIFQR